MRGQGKHKGEQLKRGRTIVAEREQAESESERMQARRKAHRKKTRSFVIVVLIVTALTLGVYLGMKELSREHYGIEGGRQDGAELDIKAQIIDEDNRGQVSTRMREYIAQLEGDFRDLGYTVTKVTIPTGTSRELYVDLAEKEGTFFKVNIDRGTAVTAEDATRMLKYIDEKGVQPGYIDIRVAGKAYYK